MSAANNNDGEQKIAEPAPPPAVAAAAAAAETTTADTQPFTEQERQELVKEFDIIKWPPENFKDDFVRPRFFVCMLRNHLQHGVCVLNSAPSVEDAKDPKKEPVKEIAVFFAHCEGVAVPEANSEQTKDYMIYPMPDNRGDSKTALLHKLTKEFIEQVCCRFGNVVIKLHTVPHPTQHGVFTIAELYLVQAGSEAELLNIPASQRCLTCKRPSAVGFCKCERVNFCSKVCRGRAVEDALHTEAECTKLMRTKVFGSLVEIRKMLDQFKKDVAERERRSALQAPPPPAASASETAPVALEVK